MKIEKDSVVRFHYTVSELGQEPIESSKERDPLAILIGHGNIIPGLEAAMMDKEAGESFGVDVKATEAYGEYREGLSQRVPKKHFWRHQAGAGHAGGAADQLRPACGDGAEGRHERGRCGSQPPDGRQGPALRRGNHRSARSHPGRA